MRVLGLILIVLLFGISALMFQRHAADIFLFIESLGVMAPVFFVAVYILATLFFLPTMVLTLAGGVLFGPVYGVFLNLTGATIGAVLAFIISRYFFYESLAKSSHPTLIKVMRGFERHGWGFVALMRVFPILPFNLVNYGLGVTPIKFKTYTLTTVIFLIPPEVLYTYFGYAGQKALFAPEQLVKDAALVIVFVLIALLWFGKKNILKLAYKSK